MDAKISFGYTGFLKQGISGISVAVSPRGSGENI